MTLLQKFFEWFQHKFLPRWADELPTWANESLGGLLLAAIGIVVGWGHWWTLLLGVLTLILSHLYERYVDIHGYNVKDEAWRAAGITAAYIVWIIVYAS